MESALAATVASQQTVLCIVFGLFLTTTVIEAQQFTIEPESVVQAEGLLAEFKCLSPEAISHLWLVNGIASTSLTSDIRVVEGSEGCPSVLTIPSSSQFNDSVIQCAAIVSVVSGRVFSRNATLKVERLSVDVLNGESNITISVTNHFTAKHLTFHVAISNEIVTFPPLNGGQNQNYRYPNHTVCDTFTFTVTPISESGMEGRSSEPVTGFFTQVTGGNLNPLISQGGNVLKKIVHLGGMVPNCTSFTSYQVTSDISEPINKTIEDPQMINVSFPTDRIINMSVTLTSIMGVRLIFQNIPIKTTDVQDLIVKTCPQESCICVSIEYVVGTLSPGALVCVIRVLSDDSLDFTSMKLVPIPRNMSHNVTIPVARSGFYRVVAFDLENNSIPRMPISIVADSENTFLINGSSSEPNPPPNVEDITVTRLPNGSAEVTSTTSDQMCLVLFWSTKSPTFLDPMVMIGLIEPPNDRTTVTLNATSDVYVVVYTWNSDSGETIFDGKVSFISQLELPTTPPPTQSPPDTTGSPVPSPILTIVLIIIGAVIVLVIAIIVGILYLVKRYNRRKYKLVHSSYNHMQGCFIRRENIRFENMSLGVNTADIDDTLPPGYVVVRAENMPSPEYETVPLVQAAKPTFTSDNPPPLPPPMIRGDSEAPDLPPPYNPAVDNESVVVMSVESSISQSAENQSVDEEVDESVKRDLSVSTVEHDGTTEEAIGSTEAQLMDVDYVDIVQGAEGGAGNNDHGGQEAMIAVQHQYILTHNPFDKVIMKDSSKVGYSKEDNDKLKPVVPPPVAKAQGKYIPVETKPASSDAKDVGASIISPVAFYDVACPEHMSLECNTDDTPPPGYDVICKENIQSHEYKTIPLALAAPTTSENPPPFPPPIIRGDEGLENDGVLTEETTSTSQAKDERTEDGGDDGLEAMITAQHQYTLVVPKPASSDAEVKDSSTVIYSEVDKDKLVPVVSPPVAKAQGQYIPVETRPASSDAKVMDSTKVVYVVVDKDKLKPVNPNDPPALPPRRPVANTEELHTEKTLALPPPPTHETLMILLHNVDNKWEDIAKALKIDEDRVDEIFTNNENDYLRLHELMECYFTNVYCSHSWEEMVRVLTEIEEHGLAGRIKAEKIRDQDATSYPAAVEYNNRQTTEDYDESIQASVQGNELKAVPPTKEINDLSNLKVVAPLPIDESNQSSVKESENDKNRSENNKNQSKLRDTQLGDNQSRIAPPPNYVTPRLLQDTVV